MTDELTAIVTAAGASTRMGTHKALLPWRGEPLVAHQVHTLCDAGFDEVVVVTGAEGERVAAAVPEVATVVHNSDWSTGRSGSIETAAAALPDTPLAILMVAVDQPLVPDILAQLVDHAGDSVVQPVDAAGHHGHPVLLSGAHVGSLRDLEGEPEGLRSLVRRLRPDGTLVRIDDLPGWDLNDPETYRQARDRAAGE